jgi:hypothetical protein
LIITNAPYTRTNPIAISFLMATAFDPAPPRFA